jgi:protein-S-isoprenylcysteine O-methyltransferase Ste14
LNTDQSGDKSPHSKSYDFNPVGEFFSSLLGLALSNWLSVVIIFAPILAASLYRIRIEEQALLEHFGDEYFEYAQSTKRLIPKVY